MKKRLFMLPVLCLVLGCASMPMMPVSQKEAAADDQIHAENRIMKRNLDLALRENEVLKTENGQYKSEVKDLKKELSGVKDDLSALTEKYNEDTTRLNEEVARLNESYAIMVTDFTRMEQENAQTINELTKQNKGLQKQLADETDRLNTVIRDQKASFDAQLKTAGDELAAAKAGCAERETALQEQLTASKQTIAEKEAAIQSLEQSRQDAMNKVTALSKTIQEQTQTIQQAEKALSEANASRQTLEKALAEKQALIDSLSRKPESEALPRPKQ